MGEKDYFQPLTREDKITVVLYRIGIFISTAVICISAFFAYSNMTGSAAGNSPMIISGYGINILLLLLYFSVGLSVFFIHLYVGKFHRILKKIYYFAVLCLAALYILGHGNPALPLLMRPPFGALLLVPLSLCLGFITAKEAFCFRLMEGYILALIMPAHIFFYSVGALNPRGAVFGLILIAVLLVLFMFRKVFMPVHYDIGDKSAYQP